MRLLKKVIYSIIFVLPFFIGTFGYLLQGEEVAAALYEAFALYFINPLVDAQNIYVMIAQWVAPLMLASGIFLAIKDFVKWVKEEWISLDKEATAVYSDMAYGEILVDNMKKGILVTDGIPRDVSNHIILFENDIECLNFYQKNMKKLEDKNVYIKLGQVDSYMMDCHDEKFFNINEMIAREYWNNNNLLGFFDGASKKIEIAIVGFDSLGQKILNYGLLNNIYDLNQEIVYHVYGDSTLCQSSLKDLDTMNSDRIVYHNENWKSAILDFIKMDRIILTGKPDIEQIQQILYVCPDKEIHFYNPDGANLEEIYNKDKLKSFGKNEEILTEVNIKSDAMYLAAKELNYKYACMYGEASGESAHKIEEMNSQWRKLNGFTKGSNIASVDYHNIRRQILKKAKEQGISYTNDELGMMEHIRWCRFHYINHWKYGIPDNGKAKDATKRIHICLVPYDELSEIDKKKDYDAVELLLELMPVK